MDMQDVMKFENQANPKESIRRMLDEAKERRKKLSIEEFEPVSLTKKAEVPVKT